MYTCVRVCVCRVCMYLIHIRIRISIGRLYTTVAQLHMIRCTIEGNLAKKNDAATGQLNVNLINSAIPFRIDTIPRPLIRCHQTIRWVDRLGHNV